MLLDIDARDQRRREEIPPDFLGNSIHPILTGDGQGNLAFWVLAVLRREPPCFVPAVALFDCAGPMKYQTLTNASLTMLYESIRSRNWFRSGWSWSAKWCRQRLSLPCWLTRTILLPRPCRVRCRWLHAPLGLSPHSDHIADIARGLPLFPGRNADAAKSTRMTLSDQSSEM
jgi:hypothetical protein